MLNKILFAAIALGLWANAAATVIRPAHADDQDTNYLSQIASKLDSINYQLEHANDLSIFEHINDLSEPFSGAFGASQRLKINQFKTNGWLAEIHSLLAEQSVVSYLLEQSNAKLARMNASLDQIDNRLTGTIDVKCH